jgi:hypothetical protein
MSMLSQKSSGHNKIQLVFKCVLNINIMNLKMYFYYESYTHLNNEYFENDLISVVNFHVQVPVRLMLFYAF